MKKNSVIQPAVRTLAFFSLLNAPLFAGMCCEEMKPMQKCLNPSARCYLDNGFEASADFLYWKPEQSKLPFAFVNTNPNREDTGFIQFINFDWSPGVRVGLGWNTDYDGWNLNADWTWMRNKSNTKVDFVTRSPLDGLFLLNELRGVHVPSFYVETNSDNTTTIPNISLGSAKASWKLLYNMFDLELSKPYSVSRRLDLTPSIGVQGGWISRHLDLFYDVMPFDDGGWSQNDETNYWGVGPRFGLDTDWKLGNCGFELFGDFASALLFGQCFNEYHDITLYTEGGAILSDNLIRITREPKRTRLVPTIQMALGLGWNKCFNYSCHDYYVNLDAAWEVNYYWNLSNFFQVQGKQAAYNSSASLDLSGLTLNAQFGF